MQWANTREARAGRRMLERRMVLCDHHLKEGLDEGSSESSFCLDMRHFEMTICPDPSERKEKEMRKGVLGARRKSETKRSEAAQKDNRENRD
jgi:hypothetical protein